ncbi:hypothetical protein Nepgr_003751 [Nepenthes gracilis]|uniref:Uncharacterized protein n=1 Tax=Nepenthes gracilis TaxID=150966 RepID=A0AAD3S064_NEPGR|nr:hypothetical protein Nepgr_003751 [Nepenthes gracilis]
MAKMRKPFSLNLVLLQKSRRVKKFKLLRHYEYRFVQEYQFSTSNTLPNVYHRKKLNDRKKNRAIHSMLLFFVCLGSFACQAREEGYSMGALPAAENAIILSREDVEIYESGGEEGSVDERAERFIEKFYEQMRLQRLESDLQLDQLLEI